jgi:predicted ATPase
LISLAQAQEIAFGVPFGTIINGWVLAEQGHAEEGIARIHEGLAGARALGIETGLPQGLAALTEAYGRAGQAEEGLKVVAETLARMEKSGERYYEAELYRLKGELTLQKGARDWGLGTRDRANQKAGSKKQKLNIPPQPPAPRRRWSRRRRSVFSKPSRLLVSSKRSRGSCGQ